MWFGIGLGVLLIVLCLGATVALVGTGLYMVGGAPDRYDEALYPDHVVTAETSKIGASGGRTEMGCREDARPDSFQHQCIWEGAPLASGQNSSLWVIITVFPTDKQEMGSGSFAAMIEAAYDRDDLKDPKSLTGIGDLAYAGWCVSPWEARVVFVKGNATVVVDYGLDPALSGAKPADWSAHAQAAARQIAAAM